MSVYPAVQHDTQIPFILKGKNGYKAVAGFVGGTGFHTGHLFIEILTFFVQHLVGIAQIDAFPFLAGNPIRRKMANLRQHGMGQERFGNLQNILAGRKLALRVQADNVDSLGFQRADLLRFPVHRRDKGADGFLKGKPSVPFQLPSAVYGQGIGRVRAGRQQQSLQQFPDGQRHTVFQAGPGGVQRRNIDFHSHRDLFLRIRDVQHRQRSQHLQRGCRIDRVRASVAKNRLILSVFPREPHQQYISRFQRQPLRVVYFRCLSGCRHRCDHNLFRHVHPWLKCLRQLRCRCRYGRGCLCLRNSILPNLRLRNGDNIVNRKHHHFH